MALSRAHIIMRNYLRSICKRWDVKLSEELVWDTLRFDFYIHTQIPVNIEVNGSQHFLNKPDGFFFKTTDELLAYKSNDAKRKALAKSGRIHLIEFTTQEVENGLTETYIQNLLEEYLEKGESEYEVRRREKEKEYKKKQREKTRESYRRFKEIQKSNRA